MLCCIDCSAIAPFPGQKRNQDYEVQSPPPLVATPGNAFMTYDDYQKQQVDNNEYEMVEAIVPEGVSPGESILVSAQDGSGRVIAATVPDGMQPGSTFQVNYPKVNWASNAVATNPTNTTPENNNYQEFNEVISQQAVNNDQTATSNPSTQMTNTPDHAAPLITNSNTVQQQNNKSMILVKVPPGTAPGSKIHVQIPGEERYIEAIVPPNVDEFFVEYTVNKNNHTQNNSQQQSSSNNENDDGVFSSLAPMIAAPLLIGAAGAAGYSMVNDDDRDNASEENFQDIDFGDY